MNPFANPEETVPYAFTEFPKPEEQVSEYSNLEGVQNYSLKGFDPNHPEEVASDEAPVVQPAVFQDFKEALAATQS